VPREIKPFAKSKPAFDIEMEIFDKPKDSYEDSYRNAYERIYGYQNKGSKAANYEREERTPNPKTSNLSNLSPNRLSKYSPHESKTFRNNYDNYEPSKYS
jgi:hypothetical protein